jgi:hypothetical protein
MENAKCNLLLWKCKSNHNEVVTSYPVG